MFITFGKKTKWLSGAMAVTYGLLIFYIALPYGHDLRADLAFPGAVGCSVLTGPHHHEFLPDYPVIDSHSVEKADTSVCVICLFITSLLSFVLILISGTGRLRLAGIFMPGGRIRPLDRHVLFLQGRAPPVQ